MQTLANWGLDSRFVLKAIIKALISKSSRSSILKTPNCLHSTPKCSTPNSQLSAQLEFFQVPWFRITIPGRVICRSLLLCIVCHRIKSTKMIFYKGETERLHYEWVHVKKRLTDRVIDRVARLAWIQAHKWKHLKFKFLGFYSLTTASTVTVL